MGQLEQACKADKGRALNQQQVLWRHGGVLILSDCGLPAFLPGQQGISGPLIESQTQSVLTLLVNPLWHLLAANLFSVKYYKKYLCILK